MFGEATSNSKALKQLMGINLVAIFVIGRQILVTSMGNSFSFACFMSDPSCDVTEQYKYVVLNAVGLDTKSCKH